VRQNAVGDRPSLLLAVLSEPFVDFLVALLFE